MAFHCEKEGCGVEITGIRGVRAKKNYCQKHYFEEIGKEMKPKEKPIKKNRKLSTFHTQDRKDKLQNSK